MPSTAQQHLGTSNHLGLSELLVLCGWKRWHKQFAIIHQRKIEGFLFLHGKPIRIHPTDTSWATLYSTLENCSISNQSLMLR